MLGERPFSQTQSYCRVEASQSFAMVAADPLVSCVQMSGHAANWDVHQLSLVARGTLLGSIDCEATVETKVRRVAKATVDKCMLDWTFVSSG